MCGVDGLMGMGIGVHSRTAQKAKGEIRILIYFIACFELIIVKEGLLCLLCFCSPPRLLSKKRAG